MACSWFRVPASCCLAFLVSRALVPVILAFLKCEFTNFVHNHKFHIQVLSL